MESGSEDQQGNSAIILAGGKSRRMGVDKAALRLGGTTFIETLISRMSERFPILVVVAQDEQRSIFKALPGLPERVHWVSDAMPGRGPLEGLVSGVDFLVENNFVAVDDWNFVVPVDMPLVDSVLADHLFAAASPGCDCIMPIKGTQKLGFPLWMRSRAAGVLRASLGQGVRRILEIDEHCATKWMDLSGMAGAGGVFESLSSINTKEDYRKLIERGNK